MRSLSSLALSILGRCRIQDDRKGFANENDGKDDWGRSGSVEELVPMIVGPNLIKNVEND